MQSNLVQKLHPGNFEGLAPVVASMLGVVLRSGFTQPDFDTLQILPDGNVFLCTDDSAFTPVLAGPLSQVQEMMMTVASRAGLTSAEFKDFEALFMHATGARLYH